MVEKDLVSGLVRQYVWGLDLSGSLGGAGGVGGLLGVRVGGKTYTACVETNGNIMGLIDGTTGVLAARWDYEAFGITTTTVEAAGPFGHELCPFRFSSKYRDVETGLYYYGYRYYSPELGRWLSRDPIEEQGGINLYGMVGNDPVNKWDYLGLIHPDRIAERGYCPLKVGFWVENGTSSQNTLFKNIAQKASDKLGKTEWRAYAGNSASAIWGKLEELTGKGRGSCIQTLTIAGHGWSGVYLSGAKKGQPAPRGRGIPGVANGSGLYLQAVTFPDGSTAPNTSAGGQTVADVKAAVTSGKIIFCEKCRIQVHACWTDRALFSALAQATGCEVVGAMGACDAPNRNNYYLWRSGANENPLETTNNNGNGFYQANPDGTGKELGNYYNARY